MAAGTGKEARAMAIESSASWSRLVDHDRDDLAALLRCYDLGGDLPVVERMKRHRDARLARRIKAASRRTPDRREAIREHSAQLLSDVRAASHRRPA